jgi:hypothetical protein
VAEASSHFYSMLQTLTSVAEQQVVLGQGEEAVTLLERLQVRTQRFVVRPDGSMAEAELAATASPSVEQVG